MPKAQFRLDNFTEVKGRTINIRSENHGKDHVPAIDWAVEMDVPNTWLSNLDPALLAMFYKAVDPQGGADEQQPTLDGVETVSSMPLLRSHDLDMPVKLTNEYAGYQLTVDSGLGGAKGNLVLQEVKVNKFSLDMKEGGTTTVRFRIQASNVGEKERGRLSSYIKGAVTKIALSPPTPRQEAIDGTQEAFNKDHPGAQPAGAGAKTAPATGNEAGDAFAEAEAAGKNKPAAEVAKPPKKRAGGGRPSLKVVTEGAAS